MRVFEVPKNRIVRWVWTHLGPEWAIAPAAVILCRVGLHDYQPRGESMWCTRCRSRQSWHPMTANGKPLAEELAKVANQRGGMSTDIRNPRVRVNERFGPCSIDLGCHRCGAEAGTACDLSNPGHQEAPADADGRRVTVQG